MVTEVAIVVVGTVGTRSKVVTVVQTSYGLVGIRGGNGEKYV